VEKRQPDHAQWGAVYGGIILVALIAARFFRPLLRLAPPCTFHALTGLPCPSCGATRSAVFLAEGHLLDSLRVNPLFFAAYVALIVWGVVGVWSSLSKRSLRLALSTWEKRALRIATVIAVVANWLYLILSRVVDHYSL